MNKKEKLKREKDQENIRVQDDLKNLERTADYSLCEFDLSNYLLHFIRGETSFTSHQKISTLTDNWVKHKLPSAFTAQLMVRGYNTQKRDKKRDRPGKHNSRLLIKS